MQAPGASLFPVYAPRKPRWNTAPVLIAVLFLHGAVAAVMQVAAQPARPLAMPADPAAAITVLLLPEGAGRRARLADLAPASPLPLPSLTLQLPAVGSDDPGRRASVDNRYLASEKLDIGPVPAGAPDFSLARKRSVAIGTVTLRVYVSAFGLPDRVEILGLPLDEDFAQTLQRALAQTTFLPGRLAGRDVAAYVDYEFQTEVVILTPPPNRRPS